MLVAGCIIGYFVMGFLSALISGYYFGNDKDLAYPFILVWPIMLPIVIIVYLEDVVDFTVNPITLGHRLNQKLKVRKERKAKERAQREFRAKEFNKALYEEDV